MSNIKIDFRKFAVQYACNNNQLLYRSRKCQKPNYLISLNEFQGSKSAQRQTLFINHQYMASRHLNPKGRQLQKLCFEN
ncbi:hypothetical protein FGO68_gene10799 [Halteria grandinella]|uniref:Uncharacterized protein n=1 Tax=Halteria grandinella TaxID=5974 RepID=A0A8J8T6X1_HALGN|nr:hypothetical protein FGO68_gene10799 [Halteria grandinella]